MKDLLGLKELTKEQILAVLAHTKSMHAIVNSPNKKAPNLSGKSVFLTFYESSTRTSSSFDHAVKILSGNSVSLSVASSSVNKGEVLIDTCTTLESLGADVIVIRHSMSGAPHLAASKVKSSVINAGDGLNEHPTQALLDFFTMQQTFGTDLKGLKVFICGDIKHSRVARSNIWGLTKLGAEVCVCAPATLMPQGIEALGCKIVKNMNDGLKGANVVMGLRMQLERQTGGIIPSIAEYFTYYGISQEKMKLADKNAILMHPGPVNRGAECDTAAVDGQSSKILEQINSGLCVRMAVLDMLIKGAL